MITRAPRSKHPPGWMLLAIADWTFPDDPIADSLKALIADAQREWAGPLTSAASMSNSSPPSGFQSSFTAVGCSSLRIDMSCV